jgi:predicted metalloprotease with PDZ domain
LLVRRAGLCSVDDYLAGDPPSGSDPAKNEIQTLQNTLGRLVQPLESASFDAWIKFYRRDESTPNTAISYYLKGAVVGWLLDVKIREATNNTKSLDTLMRTAYTRFSGDRGYSAPEFRALASEIAGVDLEPFLKHALETTRELEYEPALKWFGLRWKPPEDSDKSHPPKSWLGAETKSDSGRLLVSHVRREGPAFAAGLNVNDEIIAFNGERVRADNLDRRLEQFHPGETVKLLVSRQDHLVELKLDLEPEPSLQYILEIDPGATPDQIAHRKSWLGE